MATEIPREIYRATDDAIDDARHIASPSVTVLSAIYPMIAAHALREAAYAMPARSGMVRADADVWLHERADEYEREAGIDG